MPYIKDWKERNAESSGGSTNNERRKSGSRKINIFMMSKNGMFVAYIYMGGVNSFSMLLFPGKRQLTVFKKPFTPSD